MTASFKINFRIIFAPIVLSICLIWSTLGYGLNKMQAISVFHLNPKDCIQFLDIKAYQQSTDYCCGPAAVMSLLRYYGKLTNHQMNHKTEMTIAKEMGTTEADGTEERQIVTWLNDHGFKAQVFYNGSLASIRRYLAKGVPVLVNWIDWGGHWVAVAGFKAKEDHRDTIFFADPAARFDDVKNADGIIYFNAERFNSMWFNSKLRKNIYIVAIPKGS